MTEIATAVHQSTNGSADPLPVDVEAGYITALRWASDNWEYPESDYDNAVLALIDAAVEEWDAATRNIARGNKVE